MRPKISISAICSDTVGEVLKTFVIDMKNNYIDNLILSLFMILMILSSNRLLDSNGILNKAKYYLPTWSDFILVISLIIMLVFISKKYKTALRLFDSVKQIFNGYFVVVASFIVAAIVRHLDGEAQASDDYIFMCIASVVAMAILCVGAGYVTFFDCLNNAKTSRQKIIFISGAFLLAVVYQAIRHIRLSSF